MKFSQVNVLGKCIIHTHRLSQITVQSLTDCNFVALNIVTSDVKKNWNKGL